MKSKMSAMMLGLMLVVFEIGWTLAQDTSNDTKSKANTRTIAGCLSKGENSPSSNEYLLTANDGSTWEVRSDTVSLADHVGHNVSATGVVKNPTAHNMKEDAKDTAKDAHLKKDNSEHGHMMITDVQMISDSCQK